MYVLVCVHAGLCVYVHVLNPWLADYMLTTCICNHADMRYMHRTWVSEQAVRWEACDAHKVL